MAALALVLVAGGLARGVVAAGAPARPTSSDERAYATLAASVARGTYGDRASGMARPLHWPPGAPVLFGAAARLDPQGGVRLVPWIQAVLGVALIAVCFGIGAVAAGPVAGLAAAAVVAAYPPLISLSGTLLSEPLGALLLAAGVLALAWALRGDRLAGFALAGALLGGAVLTRTDHLFGPPLAAIVLALMLWRAGGARRALTVGGTLLAGYLVVLAPWVAVRLGPRRSTRARDRGLRAGAVRRHLPAGRWQHPGHEARARATPRARASRRCARRPTSASAAARCSPSSPHAAPSWASPRRSSARAGRTCVATRSASRSPSRA